MAYNPIQFQHGMSLPELLRSFGTEAACCEAMMRRALAAGLCLPALHQ